VLLFFDVSGVHGDSIERIRSVIISDFLSGVSFTKKNRYDIVDFRISDLSVKDLFIIPPRKLPVGLHYYAGEDEKVTIRLKNESALSELRAAALLQNDLRIEVVMEDDRESPLRRFFGGILPLDFSMKVEIPFMIGKETPCDRVTRVFYRSIDSALRREVRLTGDSRVPIKLDRMFSLLLTNDIEPFIHSLGVPDQKNACFDGLHLLKWLRNEEIDHFDLSSYALRRGLKDALRGVASSLASLKWERYHFEIELIGYTDQVPFQSLKSRPVTPSETGIDDWSHVRNPLEIYYNNCQDDRVMGSGPKSIPFGAETGNFVGREVNDNCKLGAARAYVATVFLINTLGVKDIQFKYGTGGILLTADKVADPLKRKVEAQIVVKSAERRPRIGRGSDYSRE
jgi:hypothetical protein